MATKLAVGDLVVQPEHAIAVSEWTLVSQERIDAFAALSGDAQWIHTDPARAAASSPFGTTIAHGFLTLSLSSHLLATAISVAGATFTVNYGLNRVRFIAPVPAGSRIRGRFAVADLKPFDGGMQVTWNLTIEREHAEKPCCVTEWLVRYYTQAVL